jgi:hypothetical protein
MLLKSGAVPYNQSCVPYFINTHMSLVNVPNLVKEHRLFGYRVNTQQAAAPIGAQEFWDRKRLRLVNKMQAPDTTYWEWCPDGEHFLTSTLSPRLRYGAHCFFFLFFFGKKSIYPLVFAI